MTSLLLFAIAGLGLQLLLLLVAIDIRNMLIRRFQPEDKHPDARLITQSAGAIVASIRELVQVIQNLDISNTVPDTEQAVDIRQTPTVRPPPKTGREVTTKSKEDLMTTKRSFQEPDPTPRSGMMLPPPPSNNEK